MEIALTNSDKFATVDKEYFETLNQFEWYLDSEGYPCTLVDKKEIRMNQFVVFLSGL